MPVYTWSQTAATNATADTAINFAEGQAPSSLNDSNRAMMAVLKKHDDDISGAIVTGGSSTAYTVASYSVFDTLAHMNGQMIAFTPHATNGATVTLNVDGIGAKPLRASPNVELPSGTLIQGTPYVATYNNSDAAWYLQGGVGNPYSIPLGGVLPYTGTTAPNSAFVLPFGQAISRTTYSTYYSLVGTTYGAGDGSTTFNVVDVRGYVPAGLDNMGGSAAGRLSGYTSVGTIGGAQTHTLTASEIPQHTHSGTTGTDSPDHTHDMGANVTSASVPQSSPTVAVLKTDNSGGSATHPSTGGASARHTHAFTTDGGTGGGAAHSIVQPTLGLNYILRII